MDVSQSSEITGSGRPFISSCCGGLLKRGREVSWVLGFVSDEDVLAVESCVGGCFIGSWRVSFLVESIVVVLEPEERHWEGDRFSLFRLGLFTGCIEDAGVE